MGRSLSVQRSWQHMLERCTRLLILGAPLAHARPQELTRAVKDEGGHATLAKFSVKEWQNLKHNDLRCVGRGAREAAAVGHETSLVAWRVSTGSALQLLTPSKLSQRQTHSLWPWRGSRNSRR